MPELQDELRALADRRTAEASGDFEAVIATARGRRHRRTAGWAVAALATAGVVVAGSTLWTGSDSDIPAADDAGQQSLVLTPSTLRPGESFVATLPDGASRRLLFSLVPVKGSPPASYLLLARAPGDSRKPTWWLANQDIGTQGFVPDYSGPGPFTLTVPGAAAPGSYKVCVQELCGMLAIRD